MMLAVSTCRRPCSNPLVMTSRDDQMVITTASSARAATDAPRVTASGVG